MKLFGVLILVLGISISRGSRSLLQSTTKDPDGALERLVEDLMILQEKLHPEATPSPTENIQSSSTTQASADTTSTTVQSTDTTTKISTTTTTKAATTTKEATTTRKVTTTKAATTKKATTTKATATTKEVTTTKEATTTKAATITKEATTTSKVEEVAVLPIDINDDDDDDELYDTPSIIEEVDGNDWDIKGIDDDSKNGVHDGEFDGEFEGDEFGGDESENIIMNIKFGRITLINLWGMIVVFLIVNCTLFYCYWRRGRKRTAFHSSSTPEPNAAPLP